MRMLSVLMFAWLAVYGFTGDEGGRGEGFVQTGDGGQTGSGGLVYMEDNLSQFSGTVFIEDHDEEVSTFRLVPAVIVKVVDAFLCGGFY